MSREGSGSGATRAMSLQPGLNAIHVNVNDGGGEKSEHLAKDEPADDGDSERTAQLRANPSAKSERQSAEERSHGGHHDGAEPQQARLVDSFDGGLAFHTLSLHSEVDHQNGVLLDDANQQDDANHGDNAEVQVGESGGQNCADTGGRNRGENRDRVNETFVQNTEHDIDGAQGGDEQNQLIGFGVLKSLSGALESGMNCVGDAELSASDLDVLNGRVERSSGSQIEGQCDGRKKALVVHGEWRGGNLGICAGADRNQVSWLWTNLHP